MYSIVLFSFKLLISETTDSSELFFLYQIIYFEISVVWDEFWLWGIQSWVYMCTMFDEKFRFQGCEKSFKSKRSLQYHQYMNHGIEDADSNIAQRYGTLRKRRLEETQMRSDYSQYLQEPVNFSSEKLASNPLNYSMRPSYQSPTNLPQDMVSKKMRLDNYPTSQSQYSSAINPALDTNFDLSVARAAEAGLQSGSAESIDGSQDLSRACQVCTKIFPKPSDLKRHMMCHTGEKPFKCEVSTLKIIKTQKANTN